MWVRDRAGVDKLPPGRSGENDQQGGDAGGDNNPSEQASFGSRAPHRRAFGNEPAARAVRHGPVLAGPAVLFWPRAAITACALALLQIECRRAFETGAAIAPPIRSQSAGLPVSGTSANPFLRDALISIAVKVRRGQLFFHRVRALPKCSKPCCSGAIQPQPRPVLDRFASHRAPP